MAKATLKMIALVQLVDSLENPRAQLRNIEELAASMKAYGVLQPLVVRPISDGLFEIIAGHRRAAAADLAGLNEVPCVVRETKGELAALQLVENTQRDDLEPLEIAAGVMAVMKSGRIQQKQLAAQLGKSQAWVSKFVTIGKAADKLRAEYIKKNPRPSIEAITAEFPDVTDNERQYHYARELEFWAEDVDTEVAVELEGGNSEEIYLAAQQIINPPAPEKKQKPLIPDPVKQAATADQAFLEDARAAVCKNLGLDPILVAVQRKGTSFFVIIELTSERQVLDFGK
jgi:ParB/RepB/Spo0J family partition protein